MSPKLYTISELQSLAFMPTDYVLPEQVVQTIQLLESCLDVSEYSGNTNAIAKDKMKKVFTKPSVHMDSKRFDKKKTNKKEVSNDEWEAMRNFKTTKIESKTGVDKRISDIRITLNKISAATYDKLSVKVFELLDEYFESEDCSDDNTTKVANAVLSVCVSNKFYSELFADVFQQMTTKYEVFAHVLREFVDETFVQEFVEYVDSEVDYNAYCKYNKTMEERKSKNTFIRNMVTRGLVTETKMVEIVEWYIDTIFAHIQMENRSKEVEELAENLFVLVSNNVALLSKHLVWTSKIYPAIETLGKSSNKQYASSSNRIVFKFMDILESL